MKQIRLIFISLFFSTLLFASENNVKKDIPSIVTLEWLKSNLNNPKLVIIDLREENLFNKSHVKNAVNIPALENLFDDKFFMPRLDSLKELFSNAGIDNESLVISYDDGTFMWSARLYWLLEILGHKNVGILDVGYNNWQENEIPITSEKTITGKKNFIPRVDNSKIQTKLSTLLSIGKKTIIDGRNESHYAGKESLAKRFGHIPTAKNYACTQNYQVSNTGSKMKDLNELKKLYKDLDKDKEIILYCDGGAESALNYIVLKQLGYKASIYDGSWVEWGNDLVVPIDNPSNK